MLGVGPVGAGASTLLRRHRAHLMHAFGGAVAVDALFDFGAEAADEALDGPGGGVAEGADGVAFDLAGDIQEQIDFAVVGFALGHALQDAPHPTGAFAARRALAAAFVLVEIGDARDGADHVGGLIHDDDGGGAEAGAVRGGHQRVEIHQHGLGLGRIDHAHRGAAVDDGFQIAPAAAHAAAMLFDELFQRNAHRLFDVAGLVHVAGDAEHLGAGVVGLPDASEPFGAAPQDG